MIGFGVNEDPSFRREFAMPGNTLQFSSTTYWYQAEPHAPPLPTILPAAERVPAPEQPFWPEKETVPSAAELRARGVKLHMLCGRADQELVFAEPGYSALAKRGYPWNGWALPVYHCRADKDEVQVEVTVPKGVPGMLRIYMVDPDNFEGGRKQRIEIGDGTIGIIEGFQGGRWVEKSLSAGQTAGGKIVVKAINTQQRSNAAISIVEWREQL